MVVVGVVGAVVAGVLGSWSYAPLVGWDVAVLVFSGWVWAATARMDAPTTQAHATADDPGRASSDLIVLAAAVASLAAVGVVLVKASAATGLAQGLLAGLGVVSVIVSWFAVHTLFMLRYARLYYLDSAGGIDFNQDEQPVYSDFAYLAFTVGMTYQVSDTDLKTRAIRETALRHGLLSYLFGAVILATAISFVVSIAGGAGGGGGG